MIDPEGYEREERAFAAGLRDDVEAAGFLPLDPDDIVARQRTSPALAGWAKGVAAAAVAAVAIGGLAFGLSRLGGEPGVATAPMAGGAAGGEAPGAGAERAEDDQMAAATAAADAGGWQVTSVAPLGERLDAAGGYAAGRFYVVGGEQQPLCPADASCPPPTRLRDGAGYDPATDSWTAIAEAPIDLVATTGVEVGGKVFFLSAQTRTTYAVAGYDPATDSWQELPTPKDPGVLVAAGDQLVNLGRPSKRGAAAVDQRWDAAASAWVSLPADPFGPAADRSGVWAGGRLLLAATEFHDDPLGSPLRRVRLASLSLETLTWTELGTAEFSATAPAAVADLVVWQDARGPAQPSQQQGDALDVQVLDVGTGAWRSFPHAVEPEGVIGLNGVVTGRWLGVDRQLLDPASGDRLPLGTPPDGNRLGQLVLGGDGGVLVFGGREGLDLSNAAGYIAVT